MFFPVSRCPPKLLKIFIKYEVTIQRIHYILKSHKTFTTGIYKLFKLKEALGITQFEVSYSKSVEYCSYGPIINWYFSEGSTYMLCQISWCSGIRKVNSMRIWVMYYVSNMFDYQFAFCVYHVESWKTCFRKYEFNPILSSFQELKVLLQIVVSKKNRLLLHKRGISHLFLLSPKPQSSPQICDPLF